MKSIQRNAATADGIWQSIITQAIKGLDILKHAKTRVTIRICVPRTPISEVRGEKLLTIEWFVPMSGRPIEYA